MSTTKLSEPAHQLMTTVIAGNLQQTGQAFLSTFPHQPEHRQTIRLCAEIEVAGLGDLLLQPTYAAFHLNAAGIKYLSETSVLN